jgi:hypothetical protein
VNLHVLNLKINDLTHWVINFGFGCHKNIIKCRGALVAGIEPLVYNYRKSFQHKHDILFEKSFIFLALLYNEAIRDSHELLVNNFLTYRQVVIFNIKFIIRFSSPPQLICNFKRVSKNCEKRQLASSCLSVCPHGTTRLPLDGFSKELPSEHFFRKSVQKIQASSKSDNNWYFTWRPIHIFDHTLPNS